MYYLFSKYASMATRIVFDCRLNYKTMEVIFWYPNHTKAIKIDDEDFDTLSQNEMDFIDFCVNAI